MFTSCGILCFVSSALIISLFLIIFILKNILYKIKCSWKAKHPEYRLSLGFFHPYCNAGGGGERVLWAAVRLLQKRYRDVHCIVYTGDVDASSSHILNKVKSQFGIDLLRPVEFVFLKSRHWIEAEKYPHFTLLFQSLGSIVLGTEALFKFVPDIYIDSMGYAFTFPIFKYLGSCKVACYVHYPTISTDMLKKISSQQFSHNNSGLISKSWIFTNIKILYYNLFALLYRLVGRNADVVMVNSSWTKNHICTLWKIPSVTFLVFPPCDLSEFKAIDVNRNKHALRILSVAQFRPEKDHALQIRAFHRFIDGLDVEERRQTILVLVGSCRNDEDRDRVTRLEELSRALGVEENVEFKINLTFHDLKQEMQSAKIALHSMWNEHFGIGIVEGMAAGLLTVAHNSGGPKLDIVIDFNGEKTGFLADDISSYANAMEIILRMPAKERLRMQNNARKSVERFSVQNFEQSFLNATQKLFM